MSSETMDAKQQNDSVQSASTRTSPHRINFSNVGHAAKSVGTKGTKVVTGVFTSFHTFISRGSVVDLAIGIVIGAAFTAVVNSIVSDLITPIIGLAGSKNLPDLYVILKCTNKTANFDCSTSAYPTVSQANAVGIVTWNYGNFFNSVINFFIISVILFFIINAYNLRVLVLKKKEVASKLKPCLYCTKEIPKLATRCPECTSVIEEI